MSTDGVGLRAMNLFVRTTARTGGNVITGHAYATMGGQALTAPCPNARGMDLAVVGESASMGHALAMPGMRVKTVVKLATALAIVVDPATESVLMGSAFACQLTQATTAVGRAVATISAVGEVNV